MNKVKRGKNKYRMTNGAEYNKALKQRGLFEVDWESIQRSV